MSVERNLLISLLKFTKEGPVLIEDINRDSRIPAVVSLNLLEKLRNEGLLYLKNDSVEVEISDRLKLAVKAASLGADVEHISNLLRWQEFEEIAAFALRSNGYTVQKNFRFTHERKRWEIDVIGCKRPQVICVDCKHWQKSISQSALNRIVDLQLQRAQQLADSLPNAKLKLDCTKWDKARFIPSVISLIPSASKFCNKVPVVPILQLQDFICQLPAYTGSIRSFSKTFKTLSQNSED